MRVLAYQPLSDAYRDLRTIERHSEGLERIIEASRREANALLPAGAQMLIYKNNSDRKGNSYGAHANYLIARDLPFGDVVEHFTDGDLLNASSETNLVDPATVIGVHWGGQAR